MEEKRAWWKRLIWEIKWVFLWVLAFAVAGIIVQSARAGGFVFIDFFGGNFIEWINSFSNFSGSVEVTSYEALKEIILRDWYYFLYSGGLISLAWSIVGFGFKLMGEEKRERTQQKTIDELEERFVHEREN